MAIFMNNVLLTIHELPWNGWGHYFENCFVRALNMIPWKIKTPFAQNVINFLPIT
jgi:hypothetical protein